MNKETIELKALIKKRLPQAEIDNYSTEGFFRSYDVLVVKLNGKRLIVEAFGPWIMIAEENNDRPIQYVVEAAVEIAPDRIFKDNQEKALEYIVKILS